MSVYCFFEVESRSIPPHVLMSEQHPHSTEPRALYSKDVLMSLYYLDSVFFFYKYKNINIQFNASVYFRCLLSLCKSAERVLVDQYSGFTVSLKFHLEIRVRCRFHGREQTIIMQTAF